MLIKYFENLEEFPMTFWQGKQVLELGAGTGIISIALALLGCNVVSTDLGDLLDLIKKNVELNNVPKHRIRVEELEWFTFNFLFKTS